MKEHPIQGDVRDWTQKALQQSPLFSRLSPHEIDTVLNMGRVQEYTPNEEIYQEGDPAQAFYMVLSGEVTVLGLQREFGYSYELQRLKALHTFGEVSLLLGNRQLSTAQALGRLYLLHFDRKAFELMMGKLAGFAIQFSRCLADKQQRISQELLPPELHLEDIGQIPQEVVSMLTPSTIQKQRIFPIYYKDSLLKACLADIPNSRALRAIQEQIPNVRLQLYRMSHETFECLTQRHGVAATPTPQPTHTPPSTSQSSAPPVVLGSFSPSDSGAPPPQAQLTAPQSSQLSLEQLIPSLAQLLSAQTSTTKRMIRKKFLSSDEKRARLAKIMPLLEEMARRNISDLHLCAQQPMRWRVDGDLQIIPQEQTLGIEDAMDILSGMMSESCIAEFEQEGHSDFSFSLEGLARFRVNIYREENGISAALRQIPLHVPTMQELRLPPGVRTLADLQQGLILVTGPTGSGKSTTIASMIRHLNERTTKHILTLEDPIEFIHASQRALVHQREIGTHTIGFNPALRAALREDPDIVLVGELRDLETVSLAMETAQTGHLVFGTLHTNNVVSTIDRIIDLFPPEQHEQARGSLAEVLKGVVSQMLCRRPQGGRAAAFEVMVVDHAIANLIRNGKSHQIPSALLGKGNNLALNGSLEELLRSGQIDAREALFRAFDKEDMRQRLGSRLR